MNNSQMHWYLIYTKPNQEIIAKKNLENQKYNVFLPIIRSYVHVSQAKKTDQPMFPRYLFIELSIKNDHWLPVKSTKGVSHFINFDNTKTSLIPLSFIKFSIYKKIFIYNFKLNYKLFILINLCNPNNSYLFPISLILHFQIIFILIQIIILK